MLLNAYNEKAVETFKLLIKSIDAEKAVVMLLKAYEEEHVELVKQMIESVDAEKAVVMLLNACKEEHIEVVKLLVEYIDVEKACVMLHVASKEGHAGVVKLLLKYVNDKVACVMLYVACKEGHVEIVELLDIYINFERARVMIHVACKEGHAEVVKRLLTCEKCKEFKLNEGNKLTKDSRIFTDCTPFMIACIEGHNKIVKLFFDHKKDEVDIDELTGDGYSCLMIACMKNFVDVVRTLLDENPSVNLQHDVSGYSAHIMACWTGNSELISMLEKVGNINKSWTTARGNDQTKIKDIVDLHVARPGQVARPWQD